MAERLTAEALLAGAALEHTVAVPGSLVGRPEAPEAGEVVIRPLTLKDVQRVAKAAKDDRMLASVLMVSQALVEPKLNVDQVSSLPAGLVQHLVARVNEVSGLELQGDALEQAVRAPLTRACFVLSRQFGWTPAECGELTVGQVLLYLEMLARESGGEPAA